MNATGEHHQHFFKNKRLTLFALIPFTLYTLIMISAGLGGLGDIAWFIAIPSILSLLISGIGIVANHKRWNLLAWISITLFQSVTGLWATMIISSGSQQRYLSSYLFSL